MQTVIIRAEYWPWNPPRKFPTGTLPMEWLQSLQKVRFDYTGISYYDREKVHPVLEQFAEIWKKKNELRSIVLPVAPRMDCLIQEEPCVKLEPHLQRTFAPLNEIHGIEPEYIADFGAPQDFFNNNTLRKLARC